LISQEKNKVFFAGLGEFKKRFKESVNVGGKVWTVRRVIVQVNSRNKQCDKRDKMFHGFGWFWLVLVGWLRWG
jgi:hypothetical protein